MIRQACVNLWRKKNRRRLIWARTRVMLRAWKISHLCWHALRKPSLYYFHIKSDTSFITWATMTWFYDRYSLSHTNWLHVQRRLWHAHHKFTNHWKRFLRKAFTELILGNMQSLLGKLFFADAIYVFNLNFRHRRSAGGKINFQRKFS